MTSPTDNRGLYRAGIDAVDPAELSAHVTATHAGVADGTVALLTVAGSYQYGLAEPGRSDLDLRGVYVARTDLLFGLQRPAEQFEIAGHDTVVYEAAKVLNLAAQGNANIVEILFSPSFVICNDDGELLVATRDACLSRRAVSRYVGYATGESKKAANIAAGTANGEGRFETSKRVKHIRHTFRLIAQAQQLATTGTLTVTVDDALAEDLAELSQLDNDAVSVELERRVGKLRAAAETGPLPAKPDFDRLEACLRELRRRHLDD